ncbi:MAG: hypothetical protein HRF43_20455 [Phycisphaerae bacterium]|jgi:hypothetical protein
MTLSPVFRSSEALAALESKGYLDRLAPALAAERGYVRRLHALLPETIDRRFLSPADEPQSDVLFLQDHFFLILFDSVYQSLGCPEDRRTLYGLLNLCVRGVVASGDNLFDDESKMDLPLEVGGGSRFASILQMLCFDHLITAVLESHAPPGRRERAAAFRRELLTSLAVIGSLEGSEEAGVDGVLPVQEMIERVHQVRGGRLFALAFIAPLIWEPPEAKEPWQVARQGIFDLGTAFQMVDDVTDFEFDLGRGSHNLLAAQVVQAGRPDELRAFHRLVQSPPGDERIVEVDFVQSAREVLLRAEQEARCGFERLAQVGHWFSPDDAGLFVRAIAGAAGDERILAVAKG